METLAHWRLADHSHRQMVRSPRIGPENRLLQNHPDLQITCPSRQFREAQNIQSLPKTRHPSTGKADRIQGCLSHKMSLPCRRLHRPVTQKQLPVKEAHFLQTQPLRVKLKPQLLTINQKIVNFQNFLLWQHPLINRSHRLQEGDFLAM